MAMDIKALTTREGVVALREMVAKLEKSSTDLVSSLNAMHTEFTNELSNLCPYKRTYEDMVDYAAVAINDASGDIESLRDRLNEMANDIEDWLNSPHATGGATPAGSAGASDDAYPESPIKVKKKVR